MAHREGSPIVIRRNEHGGGRLLGLATAALLSIAAVQISTPYKVDRPNVSAPALNSQAREQASQEVPTVALHDPNRLFWMLGQPDDPYGQAVYPVTPDEIKEWQEKGVYDPERVAIIQGRLTPGPDLRNPTLLLTLVIDGHEVGTDLANLRLDGEAPHPLRPLVFPPPNFS